MEPIIAAHGWLGRVDTCVQHPWPAACSQCSGGSSEECCWTADWTDRGCSALSRSQTSQSLSSCAWSHDYFCNLWQNNFNTFTFHLAGPTFQELLKVRPAPTKDSEWYGLPWCPTSPSLSSYAWRALQLLLKFMTDQVYHFWFRLIGATLK